LIDKQKLEQKKLKLVKDLRLRAEKLGFDSFGITCANTNPNLAKNLDIALKAGWHGDMEWLANTALRRTSPKGLWPEVKSVIMLGLNYAPTENPLPLLKQKSKGNISVYARNRDYHDIIKGRLKELASLLARGADANVKVFVDTAPVMEKPLAQAAGLGWQGKHSVLVSREFGSWLFLGAIFCDVELPADEPQIERCGSCTKCLDICPTNAFPAPFKLDATKCLAYYNNEYKGHIPLQFRTHMGNRIYGCDDCLAICPWNKFATISKEMKLQARKDLEEPKLAELINLDDKAFRELFSGSPIKRLGHTRFIRNVLIAVGNSNDKSLLEGVKTRLKSKEPLIRAMAVWAFRSLASEVEIAKEKSKYLAGETDPIVATEWSENL
jgi:epoxyqueuosine reductase